MRRAPFILALLALLVLARDAYGAVPRTKRGAARGAAATAAMARIPAGKFLPLYDAGRGAVQVDAFRLDRDPVTRGEFLAFVREVPRWRRDAIRPLFAERGYLARWPGALDAGTTADLRRPVTNVSWFAAKAYCEWRGARLPSAAEWEYAAAASRTRRDASRDRAHVQRLMALYTAPRRQPLREAGQGAANVYGVRDLHGLVWEWVDDFNGVMVSDDSRGVGARDDALFCASGALGATDRDNYPAFLRYAFRAGLTGRTTVETLGFRCATSA